MTEEVQQNLAEVDSAPAPTVTATPETEVQTSETPEVVSKTFTQEELDAAIGKRLAREQRKWEREQTQRQSEQQTLQAAPVTSADQFESTEALSLIHISEPTRPY